MEKENKKEVKGRSHIIYISIIGFLILSLTVLTVTFLIIHHINRDSVHSVSNHVEENISKEQSPPTRAPGDLGSNFEILTEPSKDIEKRSAHRLRRQTASTTPAGTTFIEELGPVTCFDNSPSDQGASSIRGSSIRGSSRRGSSRRGSSRRGSSRRGSSRRGSSRRGSSRQASSRQGSSRRGSSRRGFSRLGFGRRGFNIRRPQRQRRALGYPCRRVFYVFCDESSRSAAAGPRAPGNSRAHRTPRSVPNPSSNPYPSLPEGVTCDLSQVRQPAPQGDNCRRVVDIICS